MCSRQILYENWQFDCFFSFNCEMPLESFTRARNHPSHTDQIGL